MKLIAIFMLAACLQVSARGEAQRITYTGKNIRLHKLFSIIREQTGYTVFGNYGLLEKSPRVSVNAHNTPLREVLRTALQGKGLDFAIEGEMIVIMQHSSLSDNVNDCNNNEAIHVIHGRVTDSTGKPISNVIVSVKGTKLIAITDNEGNYSLLNVDPAKAVLVFSFVGYGVQEIPLNGRTDVSVVLKELPQQLEDVGVIVNTGYQRLPKERATGSFSILDNNTLSKRPVSNLSTALEGLVAGMQGAANSNGTVNYIIRGTSSMYASAVPLLVVDGFIVANSDFTTINPNDVENVTVLKDAAAASIWGARAANGVIVVTTKTARQKKLLVEANVFTKLSDNIDLNQVLTRADASDFVKYEQLAWKNKWVLSPYAGSFSDMYKTLTLAQEYLYQKDAGTINDTQLQTGLDSLSKINNNQQIKDYLLQRPVLSQYNVTLSGTAGGLTSYTSLLYENNKDGFIKNKYDKFSLNFNNQYKPVDFLTFSLNGYFQYQTLQNSGATISEINALSPYETLLNPDGNYSINLKDYNREQLQQMPLSKFSYPDWNYNLLREVRDRDLKSLNWTARVQVGLSIRIIKGLSIDSKVQYERGKVETNNFYNEDSYYTRNTVNTYTQYTPLTKTVGTAYVPKGGILQKSDGTTENYVFRNQLNFDRRFGNIHEITFIAGSEISQLTTTSTAYPYLYGYNPKTLQSSYPQYGYGTSVAPITNFQGSTATIPGGNTTLGWRKDKYVSFYGNAGYTVFGKYTLSASARSDASNYITDNPSLRWSPLWSVGLLWNAKKEIFLQNVDALNTLRVRLTYGKNGNAEKSTSTKAILNVSSAVSATTGTTTATISDYGNPTLRWEKTNTVNGGIDFGLWSDRLTGSIDVYNKLGTDITGLVTLPAATGTTSQKYNNAKILNRGIELTLGSRVNVGRFQYNPLLTYAYNYNRIKDLYLPNQYVYTVLGTNAFVQGKPIQPVYAFIYKGMQDGVPYVQGVNNALQSFNDLTLYNNTLAGPFLPYKGTAIPPHTLGLTNNFSYGDFYATAILIGKFGAVYRNPTFNYATTVGGNKTTVDRFVADVFNNTNHDILPDFPLPNNNSSYRWDRYYPYLNTLVESASYVELKEVSVGYKIPSGTIAKIGLKSARVFVQARNLGLIWEANNKGYNPEWLPGTNKPLATLLAGVNIQL